MKLFSYKDCLTFWKQSLRYADRLANPRLLIPLVSIAYGVGYYWFPARPGNNSMYPLGWWGWFDQGNYLREALAIAHADFSPQKYFYPPLYPALGAIFIRWWGQHPFVLINLICFVGYFVVFFRYASLWVPRAIAFVLFATTTLASFIIFQNFIIPWTTSVTTALFSVVIYGLIRLWESQRNPSLPSISVALCACVGLAAGLVITARPLDVVVSGVLWLFFCFQLWRMGVVRKIAPGAAFERVVATTIAIVVGPALFIICNLFIYGAPLGSYLNAATGNGYYPADIAEKFVSLMLDGYSLYLEPRSGFIQHFPWVLLSLPAMLLVILRGNWLQRALATAICLQFALYLPYGDLLPNGLWRYLSIHYFKWTIPYLALMGWLLPVWVVREWQRQKRRGYVLGSFVVLCIALLLSIHFQNNVREVPCSIEKNGATEAGQLSIDLPSEPIDFIDFRELRSGFLEIYFGEHRLWIDGIELQKVRDFRVLPAPWGLRILLIRPRTGRHLTFQPDVRIAIPVQDVTVGVGVYHFALGKPELYPSEESYYPPKLYQLGDTIDFSSQGNSDGYVDRGWSAPEAWGRWSDGRKAIVRLRLADGARKRLQLNLQNGAYVSQKPPAAYGV